MSDATATADETLPRPVSHTYVDDAPVLKVTGLSKRFGAGCPYCADPDARLERNICPVCGTVHAVRNVSLEVPRRDLRDRGRVRLRQVPPSCSASTSTRIPPRATCASPRFDGGAENCFAVSRQQQRYIRDRIFGMVYQNPYLGLRMNFSSLSNIAEKQIAAGVRNVHQMVDRGEELLGRVKIPLRRKQDPPRAFSGGMQQRVQMHKALSNEPPVLFLDEGHHGARPLGAGPRARPHPAAPPRPRRLDGGRLARPRRHPASGGPHHRHARRSGDRARPHPIRSCKIRSTPTTQELVYSLL